MLELLGSSADGRRRALDLGQRLSWTAEPRRLTETTEVGADEVWVSRAVGSHSAFTVRKEVKTRRR